MIIAGVDYSLTCPAMCVFDDEDGEFSFEKCNFYNVVWKFAFYVCN